MKMDKKHTKQCMSTHTLLHKLFGVGLGMILATLLHLTFWGNIVIGLIFVGLAFVADLLIGSKKR